ncbi:MAG: hypothetical protein HYZ37_02865 [Candidatus Solibacter usitatus]|nr:hypothetical protein [Candidatus Solibacter usitatus]
MGLRVRQAKRISQSRKLTLSTVVSEALAEGLRSQLVMERSNEVLAGYRRAFSGFSDDELLVLDGVVMNSSEAYGDSRN